MSKPRLIAFYLPQFYPTKENDEWWGKGFTEWTNVGKARPLFKGHYQPRVPADLGYYDLRVPEVREQQAEMAKNADIEGFCYWHYWSDGTRMLSHVFKEVLDSGKPDFPFCLCWANHHWHKKSWTESGKDILLLEQKYPGKDDYTQHFYAMLPAFKDERYMKIDGKLIFGVFLPSGIPDPKLFFDTWNNLAKKEGLSGFHFFAYSNIKEDSEKYLQEGYDSVVLNLEWEFKNRKNFFYRAWCKLKRDYLKFAYKIPYKKYVDICCELYDADVKVKPCLLPNFDHSPRSGTRGLILHDSTPSLWKKLCSKIFNIRRTIPHEDNVVFIKAWNEWGEGNYLEPDLRFKDGYLRELQKAYENVQ